MSCTCPNCKDSSVFVNKVAIAAMMRRMGVVGIEITTEELAACLDVALSMALTDNGVEYQLLTAAQVQAVKMAKYPGGVAQA